MEQPSHGDGARRRSSSRTLLPRSRALPALILLVAMAPASAAGLGPETPLARSAERWVRSTLAALSLEEKAAQLVMIRAYGRYAHPESEDHRWLLHQVRDTGVGGLVIFDSDLESIPSLLNGLQRQAPLPLLVAADLERGMAFRVRRGTVSLPYAMALGATRSEELARFAGEVTAREGRALGIHWAFAPVVDVNVNPQNPVINIRSFGEDPELVARLGGAFVQGVQEGGMMATVKHFPGHGDTAVDSHRARPVVEADIDRLRAVELLPFRRAVEKGVAAVMLGHLTVPALDPSGSPATLSPAMVTALLREEMGFDGLIVTDAIEMAGIRPAWTGEAAVRAVAAGADVLLLPPDPKIVVQSLVRAVAEGQLDEERIDASVARVLTAKARLGLHRERRTDPQALRREVARPADVARAEEAAARAVTVIENDDDLLPLYAHQDLRLLHLVLTGEVQDRNVMGLPEHELRRRRIPFTSYTLGPEVSDRSREEILLRAPEHSHVVVSSFIQRRSSGDALSPSQQQLVERLQELGHRVILLSFGSPYLINRLPEVGAYLCTYGPARSSQRAAMAALFGERAIEGTLPVSLSEHYPYGHGLAIPRLSMTLEESRPEAAGFRPEGLAEIDRLMRDFVEEGAFPGAVVAVGRNGRLVHLRAYGRHAYSEQAPEITPETIYDLASLTKVIATTTMAMILVDEEKLDLDKPVQDFLPRFVGAGKEKVTVRHLLTHSSGVDWWAPLYQDTEGKEAYLEKIQAMDLVYEPGSKSVYSDLGLILLGEILERVAGQPLDRFVEERVFSPLGMDDTGYRPDAPLHRIAPTEEDLEWRGRLVHGEVHDENAFALGGVAPHAGLFGTAPDLARFAQMILNGGVFEHHRIVSRQTVELFTRRAGIPESTRGLGWDTKSAEGSSAGSLFSPSSFGHTGFTGTSLWIDPERGLFLIILTNRVHPTRENNTIREVRPAVADAVIRALEETP